MSILKKIFQKRYCDKCNKYERLVNKAEHLSTEYKKSEIKLLSFQKIVNLTENYNETILKMYEENEAIFIITVNYEYNFLNTHLSGINMYGYLVNKYTTNPKNMVYLYSEIRYNNEYFDKVDYVEIVDFVCNHPGCGYGSKIMNEFLKIVRITNTKKIIGELSLVDEICDDNNMKRRNHFYQKFGFKIKDRKIIKELH